MIETRIALWLALTAGLALGAWALHRHIWQQGYDIAAAECKDADNAARIAQLERELAHALAAEAIGQQARTVVAERIGAINVETRNSVEIIRANWDRPACPLPERVRQELQDGIDAANAAARGLRDASARADT